MKIPLLICFVLKKVVKKKNLIRIVRITSPVLQLMAMQHTGHMISVVYHVTSAKVIVTKYGLNEIILSIISIKNSNCKIKKLFYKQT